MRVFMVVILCAVAVGCAGEELAHAQVPKPGLIGVVLEDDAALVRPAIDAWPEHSEMPGAAIVLAALRARFVASTSAAGAVAQVLAARVEGLSELRNSRDHAACGAGPAAVRWGRLVSLRETET